MKTLIWWECQWQRDHQIHMTLHSVQFQPLGAEESWMLNHSARKPFPFHQTNDCTWSHFILVWQFAVQHNFCNATSGQERMHLFVLWLWLFPLMRILPLLVTGFNSQVFANKPTTLTLRALQACNVLAWVMLPQMQPGSNSRERVSIYFLHPSWAVMEMQYKWHGRKWEKRNLKFLKTNPIFTANHRFWLQTGLKCLVPWGMRPQLKNLLRCTCKIASLPAFCFICFTAINSSDSDICSD